MNAVTMRKKKSTYIIMFHLCFLHHPGNYTNCLQTFGYAAVGCFGFFATLTSPPLSPSLFPSLRPLPPPPFFSPTLLRDEIVHSSYTRKMLTAIREKVEEEEKEDEGEEEG